MAKKTKAESFKIRVPATSGNVGPGFDCTGLALNVFNDFKITLLDKGPSRFKGKGTCTKVDSERNPFTDAYRRVFREAGEKPRPVAVEADGKIPIARGMGSSATAIVAGAFAANVVLGWPSSFPFSLSRILTLCSRVEGHPDNVTPAIMGGLTASVDNGENVVVKVEKPHENWRVAMLIPSYELSTERARKAIPKSIAHRDAVHNLARVPLLIDAIVYGRHEELAALLDDRLHEPYRKKLIKGFSAIKSAAMDAGASAVWLSGAGPSMAAFCWGQARANKVAAAMKSAATKSKVKAEARVLKPHTEGAFLY